MALTAPSGARGLRSEHERISRPSCCCSCHRWILRSPMRLSRTHARTYSSPLSAALRWRSACIRHNTTGHDMDHGALSFSTISTRNARTALCVINRSHGRSLHPLPFLHPSSLGYIIVLGQQDHDHIPSSSPRLMLGPGPRFSSVTSSKHAKWAKKEAEGTRQCVDRDDDDDDR